MLCNGSAVSRTTYSALFAKIGTLYGTGDGSTTFTLPNLTDRVIWGSGTAGTVKAAGLPNITGSIKSYSSIGAGLIGNDNNNARSGAFHAGSAGSYGVEYNGEYSSKCALNFTASKSNTIYGASTTVQPPALTMRMYIKY